MKKIYFVATLWISWQLASAQSCPIASTSQVSSFPNTYYPAGQTNVPAGSSSIVLGAPSAGSDAINAGDLLLVIQTQGAQFRSVNNSAYGQNSNTGNGYLVTSGLIVGYMEYVVANNSVPLTGGTLYTKSPLTHSYQSTSFGADGQYTYQVIRVPIYYDMQLTSTITAPAWDGSTGGVVVLYAGHNMDLNGQLVTASAAGFRGGGGRQQNGGSGGTGSDYMTTTSLNADGAKGEGIAGTPAYVLSNNTLVFTGNEGYPGGSNARGGPGNAGGGGTDANPSSNDQNSGGGGGGNGGAGGIGGNSWSSNRAVGGKPGTTFGQSSPSRLVMGGGGGAGTSNDGTGIPGSGLASSGAAGGGIIIMIANTIFGTGTVSADGDAGNSTVQNDGSGGGGAGGSILIYSNSGVLGTITATANGGNGGSNENAGGPNHGPGGGGGGGVIYSNKPLSSATVAGGLAGFTNANTTNYGAAPGSAGLITSNISASSIASPNYSCAVLAANNINFSANLKDGVVDLGWSATSDAATEDFVVEKSDDGTHFYAIAGAEPKTPARSVDFYESTDNLSSSTGSAFFYRIAEARSSGDSVYSRIVRIQTASTEQEFTAYPNPTSGAVTVRFYSLTPRTMNLQLFNLQGAVLWQQVYFANAGSNVLTVGKFSSLPAGMYILSWTDGRAKGQTMIMVKR